MFSPAGGLQSLALILIKHIQTANEGLQHHWKRLELNSAGRQDWTRCIRDGQWMVSSPDISPELL